MAHALLQPRRHLLHLWASVSGRLSGRHPCSRCRYRHRGPPWYGAIRATPFLPTQTAPAPPREDATGTSGRESRCSAGSPRRRRAASRARAARPAARRGRLAGRRVGGAREGGGRAARVELSSILGGLTARTRGTRAHLRQSFHLPSLHQGMSAGRRLHVGWCRCSARPWYSGCYLGSSRHGKRHWGYHPRLNHHHPNSNHQNPN